MEKNKIIRRTAGSVTNGFEKLTADFIELFDGFNGVSCERTAESEDGTTPARVKIFLDRNKKMYLCIEADTNTVVRISLHSIDAFDGSDNSVYVDQRTTKSEKLAYSFAKTDYGAVFSILPPVSDIKASLADSYLQNFFTTFETSDGRTVNGFIFCVISKDETSSTSTTSYILTEEHDTFEVVDFSKFILGNTANQTVLVNATSYGKPLVCNHLYKKVQTEESKFGKITLANRTFISGSHFCLECREE